MRARNIKPGFFDNECLAECDPLSRILFAGLWCYADREGRFEWRPKRIKAKILPYDDCDIEKLLGDLIRCGFIDSYTVNGLEYGLILHFHKHQNPHPHEAKSTCPPPENKDDVITCHEMSTKCRADSLIPDSLIPNTKNPRRRNAAENPPSHQIIALYHEILPEFPKVKKWTDKRKRLLHARWVEEKKRQTLEWWRGFFEHVRKSDFLTSPKERRWKPDLEWLLEKSHFVRICEGYYH